MSDAAFHTLEVTLISAEGLTANHRPVKNKAFATLRTQQDKGAAPKSYSALSWNEKLTVRLPTTSPGVVVDVLRKGSSRDKIVGTARIPKSDFTGEYSVPVPNHLHFLSYRLRDPRGVRNGIINVAVRVTSSCSSSPGLGMSRAAPCSGGGGGGGGYGGERAVVGYPVARRMTASRKSR